MELATRVALLEQQVRTLGERFDDLEAEVITGEGMPAGRLPLRQRVHVLEGAKAAQSAAESAVSALKADDHAKKADWQAHRAARLTAVNACIAGTAVAVSIVGLAIHHFH